MRTSEQRITMRAAVAAVTTLLLGFTPVAAQAEPKPMVMKITTPTLNAAPDLYAKRFGAAVEKQSNGRIKAEVYPASQLGPIPRQIEGTQFGSIQCAVIPPEFFVGVDERFEVLAAPGLVSSTVAGQHLAADPLVLKTVLGYGANKGLRGVGLFFAELAHVLSRTPIRHLTDFKGKKIRIFASDFQRTAFQRLGASAIPMSPSDVLVAIQQGTLDGAVAGIQLLSGMQFWDAAKYVTMTNLSSIFIVVECSSKWYQSLPADLQQIVEAAAVAESKAINPAADEITKAALKRWVDAKGELINLPPDEQAQMFKTLASVGADVAKTKPHVQEAYKIVTDAVARLK